VLGALAAVAMACGTKEAPTGLQPTGPVGRVRFVNLISDPTRNPVNAILEHVPFGVNLGYGGSTPSSLPAPNTANYSSVLAGGRTLVLEKTADTTVTVSTLTFTMAANEDWTIFAAGGTAGGAITWTTRKDDNTTAIPSGQAAVRIVNMSPAAGAIDVFITAPNADLSTATPVATNLAQGQSQSVNIPAISSYQVRAVPTGTAPANRAANVIVSATPNIPMTAGTGRTIVIADKAAGGSPAVAFVLTDR
jgi:hypothetical protein